MQPIIYNESKEWEPSVLKKVSEINAKFRRIRESKSTTSYLVLSPMPDKINYVKNLRMKMLKGE